MDKGERAFSKKVTSVLTSPERSGASHRVTQKLAGGTDQSAPTYANGRKVTNKRKVDPRGANAAARFGVQESRP